MTLIGLLLNSHECNLGLLSLNVIDTSVLVMCGMMPEAMPEETTMIQYHTQKGISSWPMEKSVCQWIFHEGQVIFLPKQNTIRGFWNDMHTKHTLVFSCEYDN